MIKALEQLTGLSRTTASYRYTLKTWCTDALAPQALFLQIIVVCTVLANIKIKDISNLLLHVPLPGRTYHIMGVLKSVVFRVRLFKL